MREQAVASKKPLFWQVYARFYDGINISMSYRKLLWDAYSRLELKTGQRILDAGCGTGNFERFLVEKNAPDVFVDAIDFSSVMLARAEKKCSDLPHLSFSFSDLNAELDFPADNFDAIVCLNVLYALKKPSRTLAEFSRVLKPGGKLVIASPREGARFGPLIVDHFRRIGNIWGFHRKLVVFFRSILIMSTTAVFPMLMNILVIIRRGRARTFHFLTPAEIEAMLEQNSLVHVRIVPAYADQSWFAVANKIPEQSSEVA